MGHDHSIEGVGTSLLTVKEIFIKRLPAIGGVFRDFSDYHHHALQANHRFRSNVSKLWDRLDKLAWKRLPCTEAALLDDVRSQAQSGNVEHSFICAAFRLHEAQQSVLKTLGDIQQSWSFLPYCAADRIEFELSAIGDKIAEGIRWASGEGMKEVFAEIAAMPLIHDIVAEAASVRSLALREFVALIGINAFVMFDKSGPSEEFSHVDIKQRLDMDEVEIVGFAEVAFTLLRTAAENATEDRDHPYTLPIIRSVCRYLG